MNRNRLIRLAWLPSAVLAVWAASTAAQALTPAQVFAKVAPSVWVVQSKQDGVHGGMSGSAIVLGPRTLVTACHVVKSATSVSVTHSGSKRIYPIVQVTADPNPKRDVCLLTTTEDIDGPAVVAAPAESVKVGETVYAIGAPLGLELTLSNGLVSSLRPQPGEPIPMIQTSAPVAPGSSGGGLFDAEGRWMGMTVSTAGVGAATLNFADPAQWAIELPARLAASREAWRKQIAALGLPMGPDGDAAPSGFAALTDMTKLPTAGMPVEGVNDAYRQFLLLAKPRAFVVTSDAHWGAIGDGAALAEVLAGCAARHARCRLYAVDDAVVWKP